MSTQNGAAFPVILPGFMGHDGVIDGEILSGGMTLRDYFAAQALAGICGDGIPGNHHKPHETARLAYGFADAMLSARSFEPQP